jgi:hypothetical protein
MNLIKNYKKFNNVTEDKIMNFSEYDPIKYNGNKLVIILMEWIRAKLLETPNIEQITYPFQKFLIESGIEKNVFMTFYNEKNKTQRIKNFNIEIIKNTIIFNDFKNAQIEEKILHK